MYAEDRVVVGVINRQQDLDLLLSQRWYRIPHRHMTEGVYTDYLAFFLSRQASRGVGISGIHYYARLRGVELQTRRQLLPHEPNHPRANDWYYQCQMDTICQRVPLIANPTRRTIAFIYTTWDRFLNAQNIADLYSTEGYYVSRVLYALPKRLVR